MQTCLIDDCEKPIFSRGYCSMHERRVRLYGDPSVVHKSGVKKGTPSPLRGRKGTSGRRVFGWFKYVTQQGYVQLQERGAGGRSFYEHRLIMGYHIGRPLRGDETVHHINGDRADNRIENLQLRSHAHGQGQASECGSCGSANIIFRGLAEASLDALAI